ncbi:hypothetical protein BHE75_00422 [Sphingomonas haloaromaticamans]|uniref:HTH merR-type domain-containing protein n=1 Tax=Edaphosphingomonas haloaromaticamans TaxID=653954 RepID=A0A1S1HAF7_9SPHN|nr:hypothetical protein BHE75_00422 [Sphingomonas haloaromaticamans]
MAGRVESGRTDKADSAFRTIGEVAQDLGIAQHVLRYWETRFPQLRPLQRAGNRRYYRPADVALVRRIDALLNREGYTIKGVQQLLAASATAPADSAPAPAPNDDDLIAALESVRDELRAALAAD